MKDVFKGTGLYEGMLRFFVIVAFFEALISFALTYLLRTPLMRLVNSNALLFTICPLVIMCVLSAAVSTVMTVKRIYFPLVVLDNAMEKVSNGDYSIRVDNSETSDLKSDVIMRHSYGYFNKMAAELGSVELLKNDFVSNVSHELKTPMSTINGYSTLLCDDDSLLPESREYAEKIFSASQKLAGLVDNILLLSKVDNQVIVTDSRAYQLDEQIRQCVVALEAKWSEKGLELDISLDEAEIDTNEGLMSHVWTNLIDNAIKYAKSAIAISLKNTAEGIEVRVSDDGEGIPEDALAHVFDRFFQADASHKAEGHGLGLAIVKRILDICGGKISAENSAEGGCCFKVLIKNEKTAENDEL